MRRGKRRQIQKGVEQENVKKKKGIRVWGSSQLRSRGGIWAGKKKIGTRVVWNNGEGKGG